ncbi:MAG: hypothetical protein H0T46_33330 [Deltaproteobacteria bacterium]|nr:hypothetical protein [Deltaproteobacteria bacterium]
MDEVLARGLADWVDVSEVVWVVTKSRLSANVKALAVQVVTELVSAGLMCAGDLTEHGFVAWDLSPTAALHRIHTEWEALGRRPELSEICWFSNTEEGDQRAHSANPHLKQ